MKAVAVDPTASHRVLYLVSKISGDLDPVVVITKISKIRELVAQGADLNCISDDDGMTSLGHAIVNGNLPILKLLIDLGASTETPINGQHPLLFTCYRRAEFVLPLVQKGAGSTMTEAEKKHTYTQMESHVPPDDLDKISAVLFGHMDEPRPEIEHTLYDFNKVKEQFSTERSENKRHFLKLLIDEGPFRPYSMSPGAACLDPLYEKFPNFKEVLDYLKREITLSGLSPKSVFTINPILLYGDPGIGKTRFIRELTKAMNLEFQMVNCGSVTAGWVLSGSSTSWQDGHPGMVHVAMRQGNTGNPLMMLDEIDKLGGDSRYDGFGALYQLLEPSTSKVFKDEAVGAEIDCSRVSWFATANSIEPIPDPIRSRLRMIEVQVPTKEQMPAIVASILSDQLEEAAESWGNYFSHTIKEEIMAWLSQQSPRDIRILLREAMGEAAIRYTSAGGSVMDLIGGKKIELEKSDFYRLRTKRQGIGF